MISDSLSCLPSRRGGAWLPLFFLFIAAGVVLTLVPRVGLALCTAVFAWWLHRQGLLLTLLGLALIIAPMRGVLSTTPVQSTFTAALARNIESGSPERRIEFVLILIIGALLLLKGTRHVWRMNLLPWGAAILAFSFLSLMWSKETELTLRKDIVTLSVFLFSLGVGAVFYGKKEAGAISLVHAVCLGSVGCSLVVLCAAVMHHQFHLLDVHWRLGALGHENQIAWIASVGLLPTWATRQRKDFWPTPLLWRICMWIPASVLVMTKSRTTIAAVIISMILAEFLVRKLSFRTVAATVVVVSALAAAAGTGTAQQFWSRGESKESIENLSGRTELWHKLLNDARDRPLLGYGYGAYWSPRKIGIIADQWAPTSAHNGYIDTTLDLGGIGTALFLLFTLVVLRESIRLTKHPGNRELGVALFMLTISVLLINFGESYFSFDKFPLILWLTFGFFVSYRLASAAIPAPSPILENARDSAGNGEAQWNLRQAL